jgi:hypothetical protein
MVANINSDGAIFAATCAKNGEAALSVCRINNQELKYEISLIQQHGFARWTSVDGGDPHDDGPDAPSGANS